MVFRLVSSQKFRRPAARRIAGNTQKAAAQDEKLVLVWVIVFLAGISWCGLRGWSGLCQGQNLSFRNRFELSQAAWRRH
jgi:hypothetical protein